MSGSNCPYCFQEMEFCFECETEWCPSCDGGCGCFVDEDDEFGEDEGEAE